MSTAPPVNGAPELRLIAGNGSPTPTRGHLVVLAVLGVGFGTSAWWGGLYATSVWGPVTLLILTAFVGALVLRRARPGWIGLLAAAGLAGMCLLAVASSRWAEASAQAYVEGHRWALYAGLFGLVALLVRDDRGRTTMLLALAAGVLLVALVTLVRLLGGAATDLLPRGRLSEPLGYVNGQAAFYLLGLWPCLAAAERAPVAAWRAAATGGSVLLVGMVLLTASRGALLALVITAAVLVAVVPGRERRALVLLSVAAAAGIATPAILDVYAETQGTRAAEVATARTAAGAILLMMAVAALATWGVERAVARLPGATRTTLARGLLAVVAVLAVAGASTRAEDIRNVLRDQANSFAQRDTSEGGPRFLSAGGNRADYWAVAVDVFRDYTVAGVGAGNYDTEYFRRRSSTEDVRQPHSLELQTAAELGLLGLVPLGLLVLGGIAAVLRAARARAAPPAALAAAGVFVGWLVHTSVDWLHLLPGVTGAAVAAVAVSSSRAVPRARLRGRDLATGLVLTGLAVIAATGVARLTLADRFRAQAATAVAAEPAVAIERADAALRLVPDDLPVLYLKAAALARLDRYEDARAVLNQAVRAEPHDFVPHALLGDIAVRRGDIDTARGDYRRASELNPLSEELRRLSQDPAAAATPAGSG